MPRPKGLPKTGGRQIGSLNKETLTKLERRAHFEKRAQEKFDEWIDKVRPEYGLDQFLGKPKEIIEITEKKQPSEKIKELARKLNEG